MTNGVPTRGRRLDRAIPAAIFVAGLVLVAALVGLGLGSAASPTTGPSDSAAIAAETATQQPTPPPTPTTAPTPRPTPTPQPTPNLVAAPLTGRLVTEAQAAQHPIAVMIDDHRDARPQSGFNAASVVWQAPAEGGIPRYMLIFGETIPAAVGPVRSARQYYIEWAAEWRAMYVHGGGSPEALQTLRASGRGQLVWNADEFRWGGRYLWRSNERFPPHNVYTDGENLRALAGVLGAADGPLPAAWTFGPPTDGDRRPVGGQIRVVYPYETVMFQYDSVTNTWPRYIDKSTVAQVDAADGVVVAPANIVILRMRFGPLNDGSKKHRLEADSIGTGEAWIGTNGRIIKGTWRKDSATSPTLVFGADGKPAVMVAGQTFVQVIALSYDFSVTAGRLPTLEYSRLPSAQR